MRRSDEKFITQLFEGWIEEAYRLRAPREYLHEFMQYTNASYSMKWFHRVICDKCQQLFEGEIKKLMVFMPPQHGKSDIVSRHFPAWALGKNPNLKIVGTSYSSDLATQFSRSVQRIIDSDDYSMVFSDTHLSDGSRATRGYVRNADMFDIVGFKGFYKAVGVGGSLTGTPADIAIIDDPVKDAKEAYSPIMRESIWEWYNSVLLTRLHNDSKQLFVMTRWHEDDLAGRLLKKEGDEWEVLSFPAICETLHDNGYSERNIGDALWQERHGIEKLKKARSLSPTNFTALYQQKPVIEGGNIVKREWFGFVTLDEFKAKRFKEPIHFYLDTAYNKKKIGIDNDPSGILAACRIDGNIYILHAQRMWKEMPDLLRFLPEYMYSHKADEQSILHIEPKANGLSVIQMLKENTPLNVKATPTPTESKETRLHVASPIIECGKVLLVRGEWNEDFLTEVCGFPAQPHDEFVDILVYAINDLKEDDLDWEKITNLNLFR